MNLEKSAIPSLIALMDDYSTLGFAQISVPSRGFERVAHYSPELVIDALTLVLYTISKESFSQLSNGGSELQRRNAIDAWRVYLHRHNNNTLH